MAMRKPFGLRLLTSLNKRWQIAGGGWRSSRDMVRGNRNANRVDLPNSSFPLSCTSVRLKIKQIQLVRKRVAVHIRLTIAKQLIYGDSFEKRQA